MGSGLEPRYFLSLLTSQLELDKRFHLASVNVLRSCLSVLFEFYTPSKKHFSSFTLHTLIGWMQGSVTGKLFAISAGEFAFIFSWFGKHL